jgi:hypothetical protein
MGQVITFYSYKGGVGRSMSLANVAVALSKWGFKTLIIDWDLEAPGLENFFREHLDVSQVAEQEGVLEYLISSQNSPSPINWRPYLTKFQVPSGKTPLHLMTAGRRDADYFKRLREFDVSRFYSEHEGGKIVEQLRNDLKEHYDFILVDSRTGVTDVGGICTIQLPDILVLLFTPTEQGLNGVKFIADSARKGQQNMPATRRRLLILPVPCRIDSNTEFKISREWTDRFAEEFAPYYNDWLPASVEKRRFIERIKLPYISYFSYGEKLPIIEQGTDDKGGLGFALEGLAALLANGLEEARMFMEERDEYIRRFKQNGNGSLAKSDPNGMVGDENTGEVPTTKPFAYSCIRTLVIPILLTLMIGSAISFWRSCTQKEEREKNIALGDAQTLGQNFGQSKVSYGIAMAFARSPEDSARLNARLGLIKTFEQVDLMEKYGASRPSEIDSAQNALKINRQELRLRDSTAKSLDSLAEQYMIRLGKIASMSELSKVRPLIFEGNAFFESGDYSAALSSYERASDSAFANILPYLIRGEEGATVVDNLTAINRRHNKQLELVNAELPQLSAEVTRLSILLKNAGQGGIDDKTRYQSLLGRLSKASRQQMQAVKNKDSFESMIKRCDRLLTIWDK